MVYKFFDKKSRGSAVAVTEPNYQLANNFIDRLLGNLRKKKFVHLLEIIFGVLI